MIHSGRLTINKITSYTNQYKTYRTKERFEPNCIICVCLMLHVSTERPKAEEYTYHHSTLCEANNHNKFAKILYLLFVVPSLPREFF